MKLKIKFGVPRHNIKTKIHTSESNNSLVVDKIVTSDDLINILEDDYRSETVHKQTRLEDIDSEFPKIEMGDAHTNIDEYLNSIVSAVYSEYDIFEKPLECVVSGLKTVQIANISVIDFIYTFSCATTNSPPTMA